MKLFSFFLLFIGFGPLTAQQTLDSVLKKHNSGKISYISVEELKMKHLNDAVVILDAREKIEYDVSHLPEAIFVGYSNFSEDEVTKILTDKSASIVVYCSIGIRSENIATKLQKAGYTNVSNLYGGIFEWKNTGYKVYQNGKETNNVHTFSKAWAKYLKNGKKIY